MAKFKFYDGNQGMDLYYALDALFDLVDVDKEGALLTYNGDAGAYDPTREPYFVRIGFDDGTIKTVKYYDWDEHLLLKVKGLDVDLTSGNDELTLKDLSNLRFAMFTGDNVVTGSDDSSGPYSDETGDSIWAGEGNVHVEANGGDDFIVDEFGRDEYLGGKGRDTVSYHVAIYYREHVKQAIEVNLDKGWIIGFDGKRDTVKSIEVVAGTHKSDTFIGDSGGNGFLGFNGKDSFNGKGGFDWVYYGADAQFGGEDGVKVNLSKGWAIDGFGKLDTLKGIEGAEGTYTNDVFTGDDKDNAYWSLGGKDTFVFLGRDFGYDYIGDFEESDRLKIKEADSIADLDIHQDGSSTIIEFANGTIELAFFDASDLDSGNFVF